MAFKSVEEFKEERYPNVFRMMSDGETADVIFLYHSKRDMLVGDAHYIRSTEYTGYVECPGAGCSICALRKPDGKQMIRPQTKIFIPLYNINKGKIEFWDRSYNEGFVNQLDRDIFNDNYADPSEYVFRITRHGDYKDQKTRYDIVAVGRNTKFPYDAILAKFNAKMPDYYENIVKCFTIPELANMVASVTQSRSSASAPVTQEYIPVPRAGYASSIPDTYVNAADAVGDIDSDIANDSILSEFDDNDGDELPDPGFN